MSKSELEIIEENLRKILKEGVLGFYNCIEVIEIVMVSKGVETNVLTLMIAESRREVDFDKKITINENWINIGVRDTSFKIVKSYLTIINFIKNFRNLLNDNCFIQEGRSDGRIYLKPKRKFVAPNSYEYVPFNSILKNNYFNGSYVYDFVNQGKVGLEIFFKKPHLLQDLSAEILKYIPIAISEVSDKIGNIIIQIPVNIINSQFSYNKVNDKLICKIAWHPHAKKRNLIITCRDEEEDKLLGQSVAVNFTSDMESAEINFDTNDSYLANIIDTENSLILTATRPSAFIKDINVNFSNVNGGFNNGVNRRFEVAGLKFNIQLQNKNNIKENIDWTKRRLYRNDIEKSKKNLEFIQFSNFENKVVNDLHWDSLKIIHELINKHGQKAIWLWDPYLTTEEIKKTLFFNSHINSEMRALTNKKLSQCSSLCVGCNSDYCMKSSFDGSEAKPFKCYKYSGEFGETINIDFRTFVGANLGDFHDRFIIFPFTDNGAQVWSLGSSLNTYGKSHHILQKVTDSQMIADVFDYLWGQLQNEKHQIWRTKR